MSTSNKNPFEIRLEILKMAKEMMDRQYEDQVALAHAMMNEFKEAGKTAEDYFSKYAPKMYDPKAIMEKAQELYGFVSKKD